MKKKPVSPINLIPLTNLKPAEDPPNSIMCAWCWQWYDETLADAGQWDGNAWSCPECIANGENNPDIFGALFGIDDSSDASKPGEGGAR